MARRTNRMGECVGCGRRFRLIAPAWEPAAVLRVPSHDRWTGSLGQISEVCGGAGLPPAG